jgi:class 3 adenylate cyclase
MAAPVAILDEKRQRRDGLRGFHPRPFIPGTPLTSPSQESVQGIVVLADLSGFTTLGVELARIHGRKRGAEELSQFLGEIHALLMRAAGHWGGMPAAFLGDAVISVFPEAEDRTDASRCAVAAALQMMKAVDEVGASQLARDLPRPAVHVAVASGLIHRLVVGDPAIRLVDLLAGPGVAEASTLLGSVKPNQVLVAERTAQQATPFLSVADWVPVPSGRAAEVTACDATPPDLSRKTAHLHPISATNLDDHPSQSWLPRPVFNRIAKGEGSLLAELRPVAPIFFALDGFDPSHPSAADRLDALVDRVQKTLQPLGGDVVDLTFSEKGTVLYAVIGALDTFEDTPARAVRAAVDVVREAPPDTVSALRAAVTFGQAQVGLIGSAERRAWAVLGSEVNLAARLLQHAAAGTVVASGKVAETCGDRFESTLIERVTLKGFAKAIPVYSIEGKRGRVTDPGSVTPASRLVGRSTELSIADACLTEARASERCGILILEGEPGIGKSRVAAEIVARAREDASETLSGSGDEIERTTPFHAWRSVLAQLGDLNALARRVDPELVDLLPLLAGIAEGVPAESPRTRELAPESRGDATQALLIRLLSSRAGPALRVLWLDDAHWLDSASAQLVRALAHRASHLLILLCQRPWQPGMSEDLRRLRDLPGARVLTLNRLSEFENAALVADSAGAAATAPDVRRALMAKAEGHPFHTVALVRSLLEQKTIRVVADQVVFADFSALGSVQGLPDSVEGLIAGRIDALDPPLHLTLKVASIIGQTFSEPPLAAIHPMKGDLAALPLQLKKLERAGIVARMQGGVWKIDHAITHDVVYHQMTAAARRELHEAYAQWLEKESTGASNEPAALLAYHWQRAENRERSVHYLDRAARQALREGAFREAVDHLEATRRLDPDWGNHQAERLTELSRAWYRLGRHEHGVAAADEVIRRLDQPVPRSSTALAFATLKETLAQLFHRALPRLFFGRARPPERERLQAVTAQYLYYSELSFYLKRLAPSIYAAIRQVNIGERVGPCDELVIAYGVLGIIGGMFGLGGVGRVYAGLAERTASGMTPSPYTRAMVTHQHNFLRVVIGELSDIIKTEPGAIALFQRLGDHARMRDCYVTLGMGQYYSGDWAGAVDSLEATRTARPGEDYFALQLVGTVYMAGMACRRGNWAEAADEIDRIAHMRWHVAGEIVEAALYAIRASEAMSRGDHSAGFVAAREALSRLAKTNYVPLGAQDVDAALFVSLLSFSAWAQAKREGREPEAKEAWELVKQAGHALRMSRWFIALAKPAWALHEGREALAARRPKAALRSFTRGIEFARRMGMRWELMLLLEARAGIPASVDGDDARPLSDEQSATRLREELRLKGPRLGPARALAGAVS